MKILIRNCLRFFLNKYNLQLKGVKQLTAESKYMSFLENIILNNSNDINQLDYIVNTSAEIIIFSKDRALQLHALIESIFYNFSEILKINIIYKTSSDIQAKSYQEVQEIFKDKNINFIKESHFRNDLIQLVFSIKATKVFFLVDDIIFTEPINIRDFISIDTNKYVASLRLGLHLCYCYTFQKKQSLPPFINDPSISKDKISWSWNEGEYDWHYPLSVDGHLFSISEIKEMLPLMEFKAPNSLEEEMQIFAPLFLKRKGLAFKKAKILNIPCNKVQDENNNISEEGEVMFFLKKWNEGYQIDYYKLQNYINISVHQNVGFEFVLRNKQRVNYPSNIK